MGMKLNQKELELKIRTSKKIEAMWFVNPLGVADKTEYQKYLNHIKKGGGFVLVRID